MKKPKLTKLSVHKNTVEKRRNRMLAKDITRAGAHMCKSADIRAYALVGIDSKGDAHTSYDTGRILPLWAFPATVQSILTEDIRGSGIVEDWTPPILPLKA